MKTKTAIFIDGSNNHAAHRALGFDIDYKLLQRHFAEDGDTLRISYYTAILDSDDHNPVRPLVDWLDYNGFEVVTKDAKEFTAADGSRKIKGNVDGEIIVDVMEASEYLDHVMLFTGDGDFVALVKYLQRKGIKVTVVSTVKSRPPMCADTLRRACDHFIDLDDIRDAIARPVREHV